MNTGVGVGVVPAILVLFPLGALWAAGRRQDPPPERRGFSRRWAPERRRTRPEAALAANT